MVTFETPTNGVYWYGTTNKDAWNAETVDFSDENTWSNTYIDGTGTDGSTLASKLSSEYLRHE